MNNTFNSALINHGYDADFWRKAFTEYWHDNTGSDANEWLDTETGEKLGNHFCYAMSDCCGRVANIADLFEYTIHATFTDE